MRRGVENGRGRSRDRRSLPTPTQFLGITAQVLEMVAVAVEHTRRHARGQPGDGRPGATYGSVG